MKALTMNKSSTNPAGHGRAPWHADAERCDLPLLGRQLRYLARHLGYLFTAGLWLLLAVFGRGTH
jgi:hypothetical protein